MSAVSGHPAINSIYPPPLERLAFLRHYLHLGLSLWCDVGEHVVIQPLHHLHHLLGVGRTGVDHLVDHFSIAVAVRCRHVDEGLWGGGGGGGSGEATKDASGWVKGHGAKPLARPLTVF